MLLLPSHWGHEGQVSLSIASNGGKRDMLLLPQSFTCNNVLHGGQE